MVKKKDFQTEIITEEEMAYIREYATSENISFALVNAFMQVESGGRKYATRFESEWRYFFRVEHFSLLNYITFKTERVAQQQSWGLFQIMGSVARELGHDGPLSMLCDYRVNTYYFFKKLNELFERYTRLNDVISSYNQGGPYMNEKGQYKNYKYVNKVLGLL